MKGCPYCGHGKFNIKLTMTGGAPVDPVIECEKCGRKIALEQVKDDEPAPAPPPAPVVPREPIPERERSEVLMAMATPDIYRRNPFRVTGLRVTATPREMARQADKLKMFEKLGTPPPASLGLPLDPAPDTEGIREAMQRLQDPEKRLIDEIFWIWPMPGESDAALGAFNGGDANAAEAIWQRAIDGPAGDVARHNLAVLRHARLVENNSTSEADWRKVLGLWLRLVKEEAFWSRISTRIRELDDPRLTTGTARRLRLTLPLALLTFNARLAVQAAERGEGDAAKRHRDIVLSSGFEQELIDEALSSAVGSVRDRLQTLCKAADAETDANPAQADEVIERLLERTKPLRDVITTVLPSSNPTRIGALDEVAMKALGCQIVFGNTTEKWTVCERLLAATLPIAVSESARSRIQQSIDTVAKNKEAGTCWFCGTDSADSAHAVEVKMHGNVQHTPTWQGTNITWNYGTIAVPRCAACKEKHAGADDKPAGLGCLGGLLGIGSCIGLQHGLDVEGGGPPLFSLIVIVISIIIGTVWKLKILRGVKGAGHANKHPAIQAKVKEGWVFGERPA